MLRAIRELGYVQLQDAGVEAYAFVVDYKLLPLSNPARVGDYKAFIE